MAADDRYKTARRRQARRLGVLRKVALRGLRLALDPVRRLEKLRTISAEEWEQAAEEGEAQASALGGED